MNEILLIHTDGGARGNPGPAGIGIVVRDGQGMVRAEHGEYIGETTNNQAEYRAVVKAFELAARCGARKLHFFLDSELVVRQLNGEYKVKDPALGAWVVRIHNLRQQYADVTFTHVPREENRDADRLVNHALDRAQA